jgi:uncharacterized protein (TIGR02594 family)
MRKTSNEGVANLTVEVYDGNSVVKVHKATVKITGHNRPSGHFQKPASFSASTRLHGFVKFTDIPVDIYTIEVSRKWYEPTIIGDVSAKIPGKDPVGSFVKPLNLAMIKFPKVAPWMKTAMGEQGQMEISGPKANPRIIEYHKASGFDAKDDSGKYNAWCASFVSWVIKQHGDTPPKDAMRALSWENFGKPVTKPTFGVIGIKKRDGGGHVAFVVGRSRDGRYLYMLGGNQNDEVNISRYLRNVWEKFVVPEDYNTIHDILPLYTKNVGTAGRED